MLLRSSPCTPSFSGLFVFLTFFSREMRQNLQSLNAPKTALDLPVRPGPYLDNPGCSGPLPSAGPPLAGLSGPYSQTLNPS